MVFLLNLRWFSGSIHEYLLILWLNLEYGEFRHNLAPFEGGVKRDELDYRAHAFHLQRPYESRCKLLSQDKGETDTPYSCDSQCEDARRGKRGCTLCGGILEMLHNASLIHDDIVDETSLRRGVPTINSSWGNHIAVLVGDYFVSNALAAGIKTGHLSIISALSALGKELSLGEIDQICNAREYHFDEESYFSVIGKKTASLFLNCVRMGAEAGKAAPETIEPMVRYAELLGLCFQIKDDIFDYFSDPKIGKPTGNDLREGKVTLPLLYALNNAPEAEAAEMKNLIMRGDLTQEEIAVLIDFAKKNGGIDYAFDTMRRLQRQAEEIIAPYPESEWKKSFREIFDYIISRDR